MNRGCTIRTNRLIVLKGLGEGGTDLVIRGEHPIYVSRRLYDNVDEHTITYAPILDFSGAFSITYIDTNPSGASYKNGVLALKGVEVIQVNLGWSWARDEESIDIAQNLDTVSIVAATKTHNYTGLTLIYTDGTSSDPSVADRRFILIGTDGDSVTKTVDLGFGNNIYYGEGLYSEDEGTVVSMLTGVNFDSTIRSAAVGFSMLPLSLSPAVFPYVAVPVDMGSSVVFIDDNSPISIDPMKSHMTGVEMTNGYISDEPYNIFIGKNGALRSAQVRLVSAS
ncbi:hypothetical protein LCGC14_0245360 [marine sediment metagenome]|uniref:Uncharacterized protein n=1 Tax=marine sediment metagenome TaxID=412755 RepID=A0A0F9U615_9ZZZZ